eukprot:scaffold85_cov358-Pavlova_lutheri.AAC.21
MSIEFRKLRFHARLRSPFRPHPSSLLRVPHHRARASRGSALRCRGPRHGTHACSGERHARRSVVVRSLRFVRVLLDVCDHELVRPRFVDEHSRTGGGGTDLHAPRRMDDACAERRPWEDRGWVRGSQRQKRPFGPPGRSEG